MISDPMRDTPLSPYAIMKETPLSNTHTHIHIHTYYERHTPLKPSPYHHISLCHPIRLYHTLSHPITTVLDKPLSPYHPMRDTPLSHHCARQTTVTLSPYERHPTITPGQTDTYTYTHTHTHPTITLSPYYHH